MSKYKFILLLLEYNLLFRSYHRYCSSDLTLTVRIIYFPFSYLFLQSIVGRLIIMGGCRIKTNFFLTGQD